MELYAGLPYWRVKNKLDDYFHPLKKDYSIDVAIIGSGITGALIAHELCKAGIECCVIDKRSIATGSSSASTALLQYEIDVPLYKMAKKLDEERALLAYQSCLQGISDIENVFREINFNPDFERVPSVYYANSNQDYSMIKKEYEMRKKHHLPVTFLDSKELKKIVGIHAKGALMNEESAQIDTYLATTSLLEFDRKKYNLDVFTHTEIEQWKEVSEGYQLITDKKYTIRCKYMIIAAGFEAGKFLPKQLMKLTSTYAIVSQPVEKENIWWKKSLLWETKDPYLYIRTDKDHRILIGGEDDDFSDPGRRNRVLHKKAQILEKKFKKLFPDIPFVTDMMWAGTFSSTEDGLPFIGPWRGKERMLFALGYGGNGITFSINAAQMILNTFNGKEDKRYAVFGFER